MGKGRERSSMLARRSSHTFTAVLGGGGGGGGGRQHSEERTTVEDIETTDSFQMHTTLVSSGGGKVSDSRDSGDNIRVSELKDTDWSSQESPIDNVGVSGPSHSYHQQATPPGPGPLHMAAKYAQS